MSDKEKISTLCNYLANKADEANRQALNAWRQYVDASTDKNKNNDNAKTVAESWRNLWKYHSTRAETLCKVLQALADANIL